MVYVCSFAPNVGVAVCSKNARYLSTPISLVPLLYALFLVVAGVVVLPSPMPTNADSLVMCIDGFRWNCFGCVANLRVWHVFHPFFASLLGTGGGPGHSTPG